MEAHFEYQRIQIAKMEANFTMEDLETILKEVKAPSLRGASQVNHILLNVSALKASNESQMEPKAKKLLSQIKKAHKEWSGIRKHLARVKDAQNYHIAWLSERPYYDPEEEGRNYRKVFIAKLEAAENALIDLEPHLFVIQKRAIGQHGPSTLKSVFLAAEIFVRLGRAWNQIGVKNVSANKRYEIVKRCMARAGEPANFDTVKTAINKHLENFPPDEAQD